MSQTIDPIMQGQQTKAIELLVERTKLIAPYLNFVIWLKANKMFEPREVKVLDEQTGNIFTITFACAPRKEEELPDMISPGAPGRPCPQCGGAGYLEGK